jgi:AcrR family transcriptional regulator
VEAAAARASNPREALREFTRAHLSTALNYQKEFSVALMECRELGPDYRAEIEALWSRYFMFIYEILDEAKAQNLIRTDLANKYIYTPMVSTLNWALLWYRSEKDLTVSEIDALFKTILFEGAAKSDYRQSHSTREACRELKLLATPISPPEFVINETYTRLLDTACTLFSRKGYFATSTREIAEAMGIQKASLYYYISSKEDLIYQISKSALEHLSSNVQAALSGISDPEHRLYVFILSHVVYLLQHQNWHAAANEELTHSFTPERKREIITMRDAYEAIARGVLSDAQAAGVLRSDISSKFLSMILLGMITNIYPWYQPGIDLPPTDLALTLADVFMSGVAPQS